MVKKKFENLVELVIAIAIPTIFIYMIMKIMGVL